MLLAQDLAPMTALLDTRMNGSKPGLGPGLAASSKGTGGQRWLSGSAMRPALLGPLVWYEHEDYLGTAVIP